ncbi:MAG: hypothetical protein KatS3mg102_2899 [Planctomycetota bacterium]|nr:MAG: hypothetical protein KatS3mg102_2899 [Planctomycetota bacterium]
MHEGARGHVTIERGALAIDGRRRLLLGGELQYFRVRARDFDGARTQELWAERLRQMREAGLDTVSSYVPWDYHAPAPGRFAWSGARALRRFCELAAAQGLSIILKPGPHILAEWPYGFGHWGAIPTWWLEANPAELVRERSGRVFRWHPLHPRLGRRRNRLPSYASEPFLHAVEGWFAAVLEQVRDLMGPGGPIIAIQLDNETNLFWSDAYRIDFHPAALARYHQRLQQRYGTLARLARAYGRRYRSFAEVRPPAAPGRGPAAAHRDWLEHQRLLAAEYLAALRGIWERLGVREPDVLFLTNDTPKTYPGLRTLLLPDGVRKNRMAGLYCLDTYPRSLPLPARALFDEPYEPDAFAKLYAHWSGQCPAVGGGARGSGAAGAGQGAGPPPRQQFAMGIEVQGGHFGLPLPIPRWRPAISPHRVLPQATRQTLLRLLAHGMRAIVLYTIAGGRNLDGSDYDFQAALPLDGRRTARLAEIEAVSRFVRHEEQRLLASRAVESPVAILTSSTQLDAARGGGLRGGQRIFGQELRGLFGWCAAAGLSPAVLDLAVAEEAELAARSVLLFPSTGDGLSAPELARLERWLRRGGLLVQLLAREPLEHWIGGGRRLGASGWQGVLSGRAPVMFFAGDAAGVFRAPVRGAERLRPPPGTEPLLRHAGEPDRALGLVRAWGAGTLAYLATSPCWLFAGRALYRARTEELEAAALMLRRLVRPLGVRRLFACGPRAEAHARREAGEQGALFVFVFSNDARGAPVRVRLRNLEALGLAPERRYRIEDALATAGGGPPPALAPAVLAAAALREQGLVLALGPYGATVLRVEPA